MIKEFLSIFPIAFLGGVVLTNIGFFLGMPHIIILIINFIYGFFFVIPIAQSLGLLENNKDNDS